MAKAKKSSGGFTPKQQEGMNKLHEFMKKQAKSLDFSLGSHLTSDRTGRNGATPTSSCAVDLILGGGIPKHRLTTISGFEGSGKTTLLQSAMANQLKKGSTLVHLKDFEGSSDGSWMKNGTGVTFDDYEGKTFFPLLDIPTGDDAFRYMMRTMDQTMELGLGELPELTHFWGIDSVPALVPEVLVEDDEAGDKPHIAIMLSKYLLVVKSKLKASNSSLVMINQLRHKIRTRGKENPIYEPGGNTIRFAADVRIRIEAMKPKWVSNYKKDYSLTTKNTEGGLAVPRAEGLWIETNPDGSTDEYVYRRVKTLKNRIFNPLKETFIRICTSHHGGDGQGIDPVWDTLRFFEELRQLDWTGKDEVTLNGKAFNYFDLKQEIERPNSELRQEALHLLDSGKAWELYAARSDANLGKPSAEGEGNDEDTEETEE